MENCAEINGKLYKNLEVEKFIKILIKRFIKVRQWHELIQEYFVYNKTMIQSYEIQSKVINR